MSLEALILHILYIYFNYKLHKQEKKIKYRLHISCFSYYNNVGGKRYGKKRIKKINRVEY